MSSNNISGPTNSNPVVKIGIIAVLLVAIIVVVIASKTKHDKSESPAEIGSSQTKKQNSDSSENINKQEAIPKLVDLGSKYCIPCKMMAPILEEMKSEYAGKMDVVFIDVNEDKRAKDYNIRLIPTQIFYSSDGKELFRHEGFFSKEDILKKWEELGVDLKSPATKTLSRWEPTVPEGLQNRRVFAEIA